MERHKYDEIAAAVYEVVRLIPRGRATSYGAIAKAVGYPNHSRFVGALMGKCGSAGSDIPAHRVVDSQGVLSGWRAFGEPMRMKELLEADGVEVAGNRIRDWRNVFWDPMSELGVD